MAQTLPKLDEAGIRAATPESLLNKPGGNVEFGGKLGLKLDSHPPHWAGTYLTCERNGEVVATLTVTSLRDNKWDADVKRQPEWWALWE